MSKKRILVMLGVSLCLLTLSFQAFARSRGGPTVFVEVSDFIYTPDSVEILAGTTVQWDNISGFHNVVADDGSFDSGPPSNSNWSYSFEFNDPGTYQYYCSAHGGPGGVGMAGVIIVVPTYNAYLPVTIKN